MCFFNRPKSSKTEMFFVIFDIGRTRRWIGVFLNKGPSSAERDNLLNLFLKTAGPIALFILKAIATLSEKVYLKEIFFVLKFSEQDKIA